MDRRNFLKSSLILTAGAAFCVDFPTFAKVMKDKGEPNLRIGVLSDIHVSGEGSKAMFQHALEFFRNRNVDGVLIAGDMADNGVEEQLKQVAEAWYAVFPNDKAPDGHKVEKLFIYGNHDVNNWDSTRKRYATEAEYQAQAIRLHRAESWKKFFHEEYKPIYMKNVKGYNFIGAHWCDGGSIDGLAEFLGANHNKLVGEKPFFYFQHPHPLNTCNGPYAWDPDDGTVTALLSQYHNAVAFSGHTHDPLTDDRDLWQGAFTSIGTASLSYVLPIGPRENSHVDGGPREDSQMKAIDGGDGHHGMLMTVFDDCIALEKREFLYDEQLGSNWIIPLGVSGAPMSYENRAKTAQIPQFNEFDQVSLSRGTGKDRAGNETRQLTVHFPSVLKKTHGVRAFEYEVQVEAKYTDIFKTGTTKRVYSPKCYLGEKHDTEEVICVFAEHELPLNYEVRFAVRPCECFGGKGKPIYSEWVPARTE